MPKIIERPAKIELAYKVLCPKKRTAPKRTVKERSPRQQQQKTQQRQLQQIAQQRHLQQLFKYSGKRQAQPPAQRVWRKTVVLDKPKPKVKVPRLFRTDRFTGLPVDYERNVARIMSYVNPQLSQSPSPETIMADILARTLAGLIGGRNRSSNDIKRQMLMILQGHSIQPSPEDLRYDEELNHFHCVCKRKPVPSPSQFPTASSKFNYNGLKIKSNQ
ncbi:hypothetical protein KR222_008528 [Zaprionus bogoriensis]|nr:hypothetical protein KR222_008528 [Zaprionus bogoriensis]